MTTVDVDVPRTLPHPLSTMGVVLPDANGALGRIVPLCLVVAALRKLAVVCTCCDAVRRLLLRSTMLTKFWRCTTGATAVPLGAALIGVLAAGTALVRL